MTSTPGRNYAIGQAFRFVNYDYAFQNFYVQNTVRIDNVNHQFLAFGFSGVTVSRNGDNVDASIVVPNNKIAQAFAIQAIEQQWLIKASIGSFDPNDPRAFSQLLYEYVGVVSAGGWEDTSIRLILNSVLDAVTGDVPHRVLESDNVGPLPVTANLRLQ